MIFHTKNNRSTLLRALDSSDLDRLSDYLEGLSPDTRKRFGPHAFDRQAIIDFYSTKVHQAYVAQDLETGNLVAYSIVRTGLETVEKKNNNDERRTSRAILERQC
jgi:hypothetical protein